MTRGLAAEMAQEQVAEMQRLGISADEAWSAMGLPWGWAVEWREVRAQMIQWLVDQHQPVRRAA